MSKRKAETISLPVFAKNIKKELEQNATFKQKWNAYTKISEPYDYETRIEKQLNSLGIIDSREDEILIERQYKDNTRIKSVVIDDAFKQWLQKKNIPFNMAAVNLYMSQITDKEATEILKAHHLNMNLTLCLYPFIITSMNGFVEDKAYTLSKEGAQKLQTMIEGAYGKGNIWVPGIITPIRDVNSKNKDILNKAYKYFSGQSEIRFNEKYGVQKNTKKNNFFPLCIPFVVKNEFNSSVYTLDQLYGTKDINETKSPTYIIDKVYFLNEYEEPQNKNKNIDIDKMTLEQYIMSSETNTEFSISKSGFKEAIANEIATPKDQSILFFCGWAEHKDVIENMRILEEHNKINGTKYFVFEKDVSYIDQFEEYFENHKTPSDIIYYLDALGTQISEFCRNDDLDNVSDDEKENIVVFIDYINENYYQTIYRTMLDRYGDILPIFDIAEYYRFEMTAASMKEDLLNIDTDLVNKAQRLVQKIWDKEHEQLFTFTVYHGINVVEEQIRKFKEETCSRANETLYITLTHFCTAIMMCGGALTVRTFVDTTHEELYGIKGGNNDWDICSKKEMEHAYTRLPNGKYLEPDENTVFTEITKD